MTARVRTATGTNVNVATQSAKDVRGATPYLEIKNEPPPQLIVDPPLVFFSDPVVKAVRLLDGAEFMNLKQRLRQRDLWLHLDFNVAVAIVVVVTLLGYVASKFGG